MEGAYLLHRCLAFALPLRGRRQTCRDLFPGNEIDSKESVGEVLTIVCESIQSVGIIEGDEGDGRLKSDLAYI